MSATSPIRVFITGATGTMGLATLEEFLSRRDGTRITVLARPSKANRKKLDPFSVMPGFRIIWGDLCSSDALADGVKDADFVLHFGGLVSPKADYDARATLRTNVASTRMLVDAILSSGRAEQTTLVYIGSVAMLGDCMPPDHWGRTGDPLIPSVNDPYALSKILAESAVVNSRLPRWVCFRQTAILAPSIIKKGSDPITFHVPLKGVLEWTTAEESAVLMAEVCTRPLPDSFFGHFYNIGGGRGFRVTNYEFESMFLKALHCPPVEKVFSPDWFALKNFHGQWYLDSDKLQELIPYRRYADMQEYFDALEKRLPFWMKLTPLAPSFLIKAAMKKIASTPPLGPLSWPRTGDNERIINAFGSRRQMQSIPSDWKEWHSLNPMTDVEPPEKRIPSPDARRTHGYDETKPEHLLDIEDMRQKAASLSGECLSGKMSAGDLLTPLQWRCAEGHTFSATPAAVLLGGHWCPQCLLRHTHFDRFKDLLKL